MIEIELPLKDGSTYGVLTEELVELQEAYAADVMAELQKARQWLLANPRKQKTRNGIKRFITGWLNRSKTGGRGVSLEASKHPSSIAYRREQAQKKLEDLPLFQQRRRADPEVVKKAIADAKKALRSP